MDVSGYWTQFLEFCHRISVSQLNSQKCNFVEFLSFRLQLVVTQNEAVKTIPRNEGYILYFYQFCCKTCFSVKQLIICHSLKQPSPKQINVTPHFIFTTSVGKKRVFIQIYLDRPCVVHDGFFCLHFIAATGLQRSVYSKTSRKTSGNNFPTEKREKKSL